MSKISFVQKTMPCLIKTVVKSCIDFQVSMFSWFDVLMVQCSHGSKFSWFYVLMVPCSNGSMFYWFHVSWFRVLLVLFPLFRHQLLNLLLHVSYFLCLLFSLPLPSPRPLSPPSFPFPSPLPLSPPPIYNLLVVNSLSPIILKIVNNNHI